MRNFSLLFVAINILLLSASCTKEEEETPQKNTLILSGTFETVVQGYSIYDFLSSEPYLSFSPRNIQNDEGMGCPVGEDGKFSVELPKGETYNCLITGGSFTYIKFSSVDGNSLTVPADAPDEFSLGKLEFTSSRIFVAENPLPWLTEGVIDTKNNNPPVISEITMKEEKKYDESDNYIGSFLKFELAVSDDLTSNRRLSYLWVLENSSNNVSLHYDEPLTKTFGGHEEYAYTDANPYSGKITVVAIDSLGGDSKISLEF